VIRQGTSGQEEEKEKKLVCCDAGDDVEVEQGSLVQSMESTSPMSRFSFQPVSVTTVS
jgi:hypothetical protein